MHAACMQPACIRSVNPTLYVFYMCGQWFSDPQCAVIWKSSIGVPFAVNCGRVLSPFLFAIYVDDLIALLRCSIRGIQFTFAIFYADDIVFLACSCLSVQKLIDICVQYRQQWNIKFNHYKSQPACFGGKCPSQEIISIGDQPLCWFDRIKYLGC